MEGNTKLERQVMKMNSVKQNNHADVDSIRVREFLKKIYKEKRIPRATKYYGKTIYRIKPEMNIILFYSDE